MVGRPRSASPRRTEVVKILVTPVLDARITAAAKREGRSVSDWGMRLFEREVSGQVAPSGGNSMENRAPTRPNLRRAKR
jgi:hypothetical protein